MSNWRMVLRFVILLAGCKVLPLLCNQIITMIKLVARQFLSSNSTFIVPCSYSSYSVPDLTEVETLTQEILNHGHEHFDKWNIFSVYHIQSIDEYKSRNILGIYTNTIYSYFQVDVFLLYHFLTGDSSWLYSENVYQRKLNHKKNSMSLPEH